MVSKQVIQILIEAEEEVSKVAKKAEDALNKMGSVGSNAMEKINNASGRIHEGFNKIHSYVDTAREKFNEFVNSSTKLGTLRNTISNVANSFGSLITNSNTAKLAMEKIKSVSDQIQSKFTSLQNKIRNFGSSVKSSLTSAFSSFGSGLKAKISSIGKSIDNLKAKMRSLASEAKKTGGSGGLGFLRSAASMTVGMLGYDLVNSIVQTTRASLNARGAIQQFGSRLNMSASEVSSFQKSLDNLQSTFKKVDMDVVGQTAMDMAYRLQLPKTSLTELTETTAIFTDAMARNGRTSEDAMLAMADAMDGQFRRLQEIGLSEEALMRNGWSGDLSDKEGLLKAMNKALKEQHYDVLAKSIDTLDDAWNALSITLSNLLESIILPLMPAILQIVSYFSDAVTGLMGFVGMLQSAWSSLPDWAQIGIGIAVVAVAIGIAVAAFGGLEAIILSLATSIAPLVIAITSISWPLVAIVAAIGLVIAAIYEVGKAFGWWSSVGGMLEAIGAGLGRLWNAFINHPDVQALISAISGALSELGSWLSWAGQQVLAFFGISTGSNWDVVKAIIDGIGGAWNNVKGAVGNVIGVIQAIYNFVVPIGQAIYEALKPIVCIIIGCSPGIIPALQMLYGVFVEIWSAIMAFIGPIISVIVNLVRGLINAFEQFKNGQINLPTLIMTVLTLLWNAYSTIILKILSLVVRFAGQMLQKAMQTGRNFVNGIMNYLQQLPGKALSTLLRVVTSIVSAGTQWISNAKDKAQAVVDGVRDVLSNTASAVSSALGGVVDAIVAPFREAYNQAKAWWDSIASLGGAAGSDAAGGEMAIARTALDLSSDKEFDIITGETVHVEVEVENKVILDLINVPAHIDTATLIRMLQDKEVLQALTSNPDFQSLDAKMKDEILARIKRAGGT